ncbi:hypothetical protein [Microbispora corallina]|uniref:hypothetical protein n=1 Tax=Microbispora corallina TaxID=83302 RepID=UPI001951B066|nr:hypothetical protein [Microbispora corallina]
MTTTKPEVGPAWRDLRKAIAAELRPYVQAHLLDDLAIRIVANHVAAPGWRPPLRPDPDVIVDARRTRTAQGLAAAPGGDQ